MNMVGIVRATPSRRYDQRRIVHLRILTCIWRSFRAVSVFTMRSFLSLCVLGLPVLLTAVELDSPSTSGLRQLLKNPSFEKTWRPKSEYGDQSSFSLSGTNLDVWQSFRVGHAPITKPFIAHTGTVALKLEGRNAGLGVIQHVVLRTVKPAQLILTAWVAGDTLEYPPNIAADVYYMDGTFSLDHKIRPRGGTYGWEFVHIVIPASRPVKSVVVSLVVDQTRMNYDEALYVDDVELYAREQDSPDPLPEQTDGGGVDFRPPDCPKGHRCWNDIAFGTKQNFLTRGIPGNDAGVTLATQLSVDRLPLLCKSAERWGGPVSAAVYVRSGNDLAVLVKERRNCKSIKNHVTFHLVTQPNSVGDVPYPVNLLRNMALDSVTTDYVFNVDVDFVPNVDAIAHINMLNKAMPHALPKGTKYMLIVPAFEFVNGAQQEDKTGWASKDDTSSDEGQVVYSCEDGVNTMVAAGDTLSLIARSYKVTLKSIHECNPHIVDTELEIGDTIIVPKAGKPEAGKDGFFNGKGVAVPKNKDDLLNGVENHRIQPVHADKFAGAHAITNYKKWYEQDLHRPYQVKFKGVFEPYMVGPKTMPRFDERFAGYGMDKVELNYQLNAAGYTLLVAPGAFVVHHNHPKAKWGMHADLVRVYKNWYAFVYEQDKTYGHGEFFPGEKEVESVQLTVEK